ncbi:hypothetical protein F4560_004873 [Saccharothrix ecbatanensis]|uniref:Uncharacterized protein n=1 Tax=Saccharothrix ecbatanensis TaxID=1105145 RepID=A0A7W9M2L1_9PSEU|nr:hypothetical protein [Saccharothrix ecbatanensis]MBB5805105.1 hypothetical protein [Saccharothrix ecbatanensis]
MPKEYVVIGLLALAGFLIGGVYSTWKTARGLAIILLILTVVTAGAALTWLL